MKPFRFTAEMFLPDGCGIGHANDCQMLKFVDRANALLEAEEMKCERVYGMEVSQGNAIPPIRIWSKEKGKHETHTALLWNIQSLNAPEGEGDEE